MDNATHTLCGLALARAGLDRLDPRATATLVAASSLPDLDIVVQLFGGQPAYLCHHRGITHALLGLCLETFLLAGLVWAWARRRALDPARTSTARRWPPTPTPPSRFWPLALVAGVGFASHLALDGLNTYGIRPFLPFSGQWYYGDVAFIVDPWLWLTLGAGAALGAPAPTASAPAPAGAPGALAPPRPIWGWVLFAVLVLEGMIVQQRIDAGPIPFLWGAGMAALVALRRQGVGLRRRRTTALLGIGAAALYLLLLGSCSRAAAGRALLAGQERFGAPVERLSCQPHPGRVHAFQAVVSSRERSAVFQVDLLRGTISLESERRRGLDDPTLLRALARAADRPEVEAWRVFARHPFLDRAGGLLIMGDARYAPEARAGWCNLAVPFEGQPDPQGRHEPGPDAQAPAPGAQ